MPLATDTRVLRRRETAAGVQGVHEAEERREASLCAGEGERLGLYAIIAEAGPVTALGLAMEAAIPMSLAQRWLASQLQSGHVVRDVITGRYRTWCILPEPETEAVMTRAIR